MTTVQPTLGTATVHGRQCGALPNSTSILFIAVKYESDEETNRYLQSIHSLPNQRELKIVVVDNTPGENRSAPPVADDTIFHQTPSNLGYFGGARYALSHYLLRNEMPEWIVISNVDLVLADPGFAQNLGKLASIPDLGAVAPSIYSDLTGIDQNPYLRTRPSQVRMHVYKWIYRNWLVLNLHELSAALFHRVRTALTISRNLPAQSANRSLETIYAPHGSIMILSRKYFERGGDLDFPEFLFGEEIYIAEKMRSLGLKVVYEPLLRVIHKEHHTTKLMKSRKIAAYAAASAAYCADTFFPMHS